MRIKVRGNSTFPVPYVYVDGIAIPVGQFHELEVTEDEENPPAIVSTAHTAAGFDIKIERPDQEVIGRKTYRNIVADGRVTVHADGAVDSEVTAGHVAAARAEVARVAADMVSLKAEMAGVSVALQAKTKEHEETQLRVMQLEEDLEAARTNMTTAGATANAEAEQLRTRIRELEALIAKGDDKPSAKTEEKGSAKASKKADAV